MRVASEGILLLIVRGSMPVIFDRVFRVQKTLSIFNNYLSLSIALFYADGLAVSSRGVVN